MNSKHIALAASGRYPLFTLLIQFHDGLFIGTDTDGFQVADFIAAFVNDNYTCCS
jgi:hypothetical protein